MTLAQRLKNLHHDTGGQAMVEAAILMPLFITIVAMTLELCVLATVKTMVDYAAYQACRAGIVHNADNEYMYAAAAMSLSPVTQSVLAAQLPWPDKADDITFLTRLAKFGVYSVVARTQFNRAISYVDYAHSGFTEGVNLSFPGAPPSPPSSPSISNMQAYLRALEQYATDLEIFLASLPVLFNLPAINQLKILDPDTGAEVTTPGAIGATADNLLTESGQSKTGIDFIAFGAGGNKDLRLRVRVIHQHRLMFPFLKMVYHHILRRGDASTSDAETMRAKVIGYVEISGDCTMRMQSNFTMAED